MTYYRITRQFTDGVLKGITYTSETSVHYNVGDTIPESRYSDGYIILNVEEIKA